MIWILVVVIVIIIYNAEKWSGIIDNLKKEVDKLDIGLTDGWIAAHQNRALFRTVFQTDIDIDVSADAAAALFDIEVSVAHAEGRIMDFKIASGFEVQYRTAAAGVDVVENKVERLTVEGFETGFEVVHADGVKLHI